MRETMQAIQVGSLQGFTWVHAALRAYGRHCGLWIIIGLMGMFISFFGIHTGTLSLIMLFFEPLLTGVFFYLAHRALTQQSLTAQACIQLIRRSFFRWLGLGILLAISTFIAYMLIFVIFVMIASGFGIINMEALSQLSNTALINWFPSPAEHVLFLSVSAIIVLLLVALIQTIVLYAPALLIARDLDYPTEMSMGHSLFSSCVGTMINWRPLFINTLYIAILLFVVFSVTSLLLMFLGQAVVLMLLPFVFYCVIVPIFLLNLYFSFRAIFIHVDSSPTITHAE